MLYGSIPISLPLFYVVLIVGRAHVIDAVCIWVLMMLGEGGGWSIGKGQIYRPTGDMSILNHTEMICICNEMERFYIKTVMFSSRLRMTIQTNDHRHWWREKIGTSRDMYVSGNSLFYHVD